MTNKAAKKLPDLPEDDVGAVADIAVLDDGAFKAELASLIPHLRAFGRNLCGNMDTADDLVQETMLKAWKARGQFQPGTSMKSWCFVILRNSFLSQMRRNKFHGEYDELVADRILVHNDEQSDHLHLGDLQRALLQLPLQQREALILIGAGGMSYEDAAAVCDCAVGTMKSRVSRARESLNAIINSGQLNQSRRDSINPSDALRDIMQSAEEISAK
jgi:RNA polymerase sigma-70 factor, ECF subfamily